MNMHLRNHAIQFYLRVLVLTLVAGSFSMSAQQNERASAAVRGPRESSPIMSSSVSYEPVNPGDLVFIYVADYPDITRTYRISENGTISIPVLATPVIVSGRTPSDIEKAVSDALLSAKLLVRPVVSVAVEEYRSRPIQISGAVKHPMTIQALGDMHLLDALAKTDGLANDAGPEILVFRHDRGATEEAVLHIPVKPLMQGLDPTLNIALNGGEQIRVPEAAKLYIVGNVKNPGIFPITDPDGLSVMKALGLCQGLLPYSQEDAVVYRVVAGSKQRTEIQVPIRKILKLKAPDVPLQGDDIVYIPDSPGRRLAANTIEKLTSVGSAAGTVLTWRAIP